MEKIGINTSMATDFSGKKKEKPKIIRRITTITAIAATTGLLIALSMMMSQPAVAESQGTALLSPGRGSGHGCGVGGGSSCAEGSGFTGGGGGGGTSVPDEHGCGSGVGGNFGTFRGGHGGECE